MAPDNAADRLQRLEDLESVRHIIASYGLLADRGDADAVAALWSKNGAYDVGGYGIATGRDAIAELIAGPTHQALMAQGCAHILSPHDIFLDGDTAIAKGYSTVFREDGDSYQAWRVSANRWELARQPDGNWLVELRINRPIDGSQLDLFL